MSNQSVQNEAGKVVGIKIEEFEDRFNKEYDFLYENDDNIAGYKEAVAAFDKFLESNSEFVGAFAAHRGDFISSDREAAAFMFALASMS